MPSAEEKVAQLGKGAIESPPDPRDYKLSFIAAAVPPIDWSRPFSLPEPPDSNQRSSDCCVAEATSYFNWQLRGRGSPCAPCSRPSRRATAHGCATAPPGS